VSKPARREEEDHPSGVLGIANTPRLVKRVLGDLNSISDLLRSVPQMTEDVAVMSKAVLTLNREIKAMHKSVDTLGEKLDYLETVSASLEAVDTHVVTMVDDVHLMRKGVDNLEPKLDSMIRTLRPMRRTAERLGLRRRGEVVLHDEPIEDELGNGDEAGAEPKPTD